MNKRIIGAILAGCMSVTMLPVMAFADDNPHDGMFESLSHKAEFQTDYRMTKHIMYDENGNVYCEEEYSYDTYGNRVRCITKNSGGTHIDWFINSYDVNGRLVNVKLNCEKYHRYAADSMQYTYNGSALASEVLTSGADTIYNHTYKYDSNGRVISDGQMNYTYGANGLVATASNTDDTETHKYEYDSNNKLIRQTNSYEDHNIVYDYKNEYDSAGRLVRVTETKDNMQTMIKEYDQNGNEVLCKRNYASESDQTQTWMKETFEYQLASALKASPVTANPFTDVYSGPWHYAPILWAYENDITKGVSTTEFGVGKSCSRAEAVTFLWRLYGSEKISNVKNPFTDVPENAYYYDAVMWAVANGITAGVSETEFAPGKICSRQECVKFFMNASGDEEENLTNSFSDINENMWSYSAVLWASAHGITSGYGNGIFGPYDSCTREQYVSFVQRYLQYMEKK